MQLESQGNIFTGYIEEIYPDNTVRVRFPKAVITGATTNPITTPEVDYKTRASIHRGYVTVGSLMYKQVDPSAIYSIGDQVAVLEFWSKIPKEPMDAKFFVIGKWRGVTLP